MIIKIPQKRRSKALAIDGQHLAKHIVRLLDIIIGDVFILIYHIQWNVRTRHFHLQYHPLFSFF